ncbi:MAG TPA: ATP-binding protein [Candidatus Paceibacterota bacterium]
MNFKTIFSLFSTETAPYIFIAILGILTIGVLVFYSLYDARQIHYRFLTVGSHKLRTPLSKISVATAELLHRKEAADARKETYVFEKYDERLLRQIAVENQRLIGLVNLLLEVSETEVGHAHYDYTEFNIIKLISETLRAYQNSQWRNDRIFLEFESALKELSVYADRRRVGSAIQVLLENAITYSPGGGKIIVRVKKQRNNVIVSILDHGMGIIKSEKRRIFNKFYRGDRALRMDTEGTGVGLFLARRIIEGHRGKLWFESEGERKGSAFYFSLPQR